MYFGAGILALMTMLGVGLFAFLGARFVVARASGIRGWLPVLAFDQKPWAAVSLGRRALFALSGTLGIYLAAALMIALGFLLSGETTVDETSMRVSVRPSSPAEEAGVRDGDRILSVAGVPIQDWDGLKAEVAKHPGEAIKVEVQRNDRTVAFTATPTSEGKIGVRPRIEQHPAGIGTALGKGLGEPAIIVGAAAKGFVRLFAGSDKPEMTGPVGISTEIGRAGESGVGRLLLLLGALMSYFLLVPSLVLSLVFLPRSRAPVTP